MALKDQLWRRKWLIGGVLVLAGIGVWWWQRGEQEEEITTVSPQIMDIEETLEVSGTIDAEEKVRLAFVAPSRLTWVGVKEGEWVNKWQGVASVDTQTLQKQLEIDINTHGKIFRGFEQTLDDVDYYSEQGLSESERRVAESAQLDIRNSALGVEIRSIAIKLSSLVAPIAGLVTRVDQPIAGVTISPTDVFEIVNPQTLFFSLVVDEEDVVGLQAGQSAQIELDAYTDQTINGVVSFVGYSPRQTTGGGTGYLVKISLPVDNLGLQYKLGMNGEARILLASKTAVMSVPVEALISGDEGMYVEVLVNGVVEERRVEIGIETFDDVEILSGLNQDDLVVVPEGTE
jgi:membrane fusion protein, multidrug efflux system